MPRLTSSCGALRAVLGAPRPGLQGAGCHSKPRPRCSRAVSPAPPEDAVWKAVTHPLGRADPLFTPCSALAGTVCNLSTTHTVADGRHFVAPPMRGNRTPVRQGWARRLWLKRRDVSFALSSERNAFPIGCYVPTKAFMRIDLRHCRLFSDFVPSFSKRCLLPSFISGGAVSPIPAVRDPPNA
eukprot:361294-Chlamydomonas_euryale.AAC.3